MPVLVLLRHAQAEPLTTDDLSRSLTPKGRADAQAVRRWLDETVLVPDRVVVSPAVRTQQTWELAGTVAPVLDDRVWEATAADLREVVGEMPAGSEVLVVVGHNPGLEQLAAQLDPTTGGLGTASALVFRSDAWDLAGAVLVARR